MRKRALEVLGVWLVFFGGPVGCRDGFVGDNATAILADGVIGRGERDASNYIVADFQAEARGDAHGVELGRAYLVQCDPEDTANYPWRRVLIAGVNRSDEPVTGIFGADIQYFTPEGDPVVGDAVNARFTGSVRESSTRSQSYQDSLGPGEMGWFDASEDQGVDPAYFGTITFDIGQKAEGNSPGHDAPSVVKAVGYEYIAGDGSQADTLTITVKNLGDREAYVNSVTHVVLDEQGRPLHFGVTRVAAWLSPGQTVDAVDETFYFHGTGSKLWTSVWMSTEVFTQ